MILRSQTLVAVVFLFAAAGFARTKPTFVRYVFTPEITPSQNVLHVELSFRGDRSGASLLILPSTWAGQSDLGHAVKNLKALSSETQLSETADPTVLQVRYQSGGTVTITYDLQQDWSGELHHPKEFRVILQPDQFVLNGFNALVHPKFDPFTEVHVELKWRRMPKNWVAASSLGLGSRTSFTGPWHEVQNILLLAGAFRTLHADASGEKLSLIIRGSWTFRDQEALDEVRRIFVSEREFWKAHDRTTFLVFLNNYDQDFGSHGGTVFTRAFQFYLSRKQKFDTDQLSSLAHEVFHTWNHYRMGVMPTDSESVEWFTEGFTTYYQDRILLRAGLLTFPDYLARLNRLIAEYWSSADRNLTQAQWLARYETKQPNYRLPYVRGAMIALWLDQLIQHRTSGRLSLDATMRSLVEGGRHRILSTESLIQMVSTADDRLLLRSFVREGTDIPLPEKIGPATLNNNGIPHYEIETPSQ
jgi:predicted metalloprotease with PDZ domain